MNKTLVIGGSGFVGSKLIEIFGEDKCINFDKNPSLLHSDISIIGDIRHINEISFKPIYKSIILLAAEHRDDVSPTSLYYDVNVMGTKNVLSKMDEYGIKNLIFTSSVAVYGLNKNNPDENHTPDPFNAYGRSKLEAENIIQEWFNKDSKGKSVTIIRPTVIFGEGNRGNVYNLFKQISTGKFLIVGKGDNRKSIAYLNNVVAFIKYRLEKAETGFHIFNYCDKPDFSMTELTTYIEKLMNLNISKFKIPYWIGIFIGYLFDFFTFLTRKKFQLSSVRVRKFCANTVFDASKAHAVFKAPYSLEEGLTRTFEYDFKDI